MERKNKRQVVVIKSCWVIFIILVNIFSGCKSISPEGTSSELYDNNNNFEDGISSQNYEEDTFTSNQPISIEEITNTPDMHCRNWNPDVSYIENTVYFSWSKESDSLVYTVDSNLQEWQSYQTGEKFNVPQIFPILSTDFDFSISIIPDFPIRLNSIAPSGKKLLYWEEAFTHPTPTPSQGLVNDREYLLDFYLVADKVLEPEFIVQVEGQVIGVFWSTDEDLVYILFEQFNYQTEYFLSRLNLEQHTFEVVLQNDQRGKYSQWVAISPDEQWIAYQFQKQKSIINLLNLSTNEKIEIKDIPDFDLLYWINNDHWLLINNQDENSNFSIYNWVSQQILSEYEFGEAVEDFPPLQPALSPNHDQIAFYGDKTKKIYIFSICN